MRTNETQTVTPALCACLKMCRVFFRAKYIMSATEKQTQKHQ